jgi:hypothetical protein
MMILRFFTIIFNKLIINCLIACNSSFTAIIYEKITIIGL